jgi:hypothetical protein
VIAALMVAGIGWRVPQFAPHLAPRPAAAGALPARLTDQEFWKLIDDLSESSGPIQTSNLVSNEQRFQQVVPELTRNAMGGRAYIGVGPEQNFTYIAALRPSMAFIVDVRRGNLDLHLLYKAIFELSADRSEFVSLLFSRSKPRRLNAKSTADDIFSAYSSLFPNWQLYNDAAAAIRNQLFRKHAFDVSADDLRAIEEVHRAFYVLGPRIRYGAQAPPPFASTTGRAAGAPWGIPIALNGAQNQPTFGELMTAADTHGIPRGFLASEDAFAFVKDLESRNLIVPVVGNFAGPKAIRAVGAYLKLRGETVSAFYLSNVEEYIRRDGSWPAFCENVSTLPLDDTSTFIRSTERTSRGSSDGFLFQLGRIAQIRCR